MVRDAQQVLDQALAVPNFLLVQQLVCAQLRGEGIDATASVGGRVLGPPESFKGMGPHILPLLVAQKARDQPLEPIQYVLPPPVGIAAWCCRHIITVTTRCNDTQYSIIRENIRFDETLAPDPTDTSNIKE